MLICAVRVCDALPQAHLSSDVRTLAGGGAPTASMMMASKQGRFSAGVEAGRRRGCGDEGCSLLALRGGSDAFSGMARGAAAFATPEVAQAAISSVSGSSALTNPRNIGARRPTVPFLLRLEIASAFELVGLREARIGDPSITYQHAPAKSSIHAHNSTD